MAKQDFQDYLYYEFNVTDPAELTQQDRIIAYERLRHKLITSDKPALDISKDLLTLHEYLKL